MRRSIDRLEATLFVLGLSAVAVLFLPFADGISPLEYLFQAKGFPFPFRSFLEGSILLPIPISVGSLLLLLTRRRVAPIVSRAAYTFGFAGAGGFLTWLVFVFSDSSNWSENALFLLLPSVVILIGGGALLIRNLRRG